MVYILGLAITSQVIFAKTYGVPSTTSEQAYACAQGPDGGYFLVGGSSVFGGGYILVVKTDPYGVVQWANRIGNGPPNSDCAYSVVATPDGGCVLAGRVESMLGLFKLSSDGTVGWSRFYFCEGYSLTPYALIRTNDGGYALTGVLMDALMASDAFVMKVSSDGYLEWTRIFGGSGAETGTSVVQTSDGSYAISGWTDSFGAGGDDIFLLKLNQNGGFVWAKTFGEGPYNESSQSVLLLPDGSLLVLGYKAGYGGHGWIMIRVLSSGDLSWKYWFPGTGAPYSGLVTDDGGFVIVGTDGVYGQGGNEDVLVMKLSSDGNLEWAKTFGGTRNDYARSIVKTAANGYAIAGWSNSFTSSNEFLLLTLDQQGNSPGCVQDCVPTSSVPVLYITSINQPPTTPSLSPSSPTIAEENQSITVTVACEPLFAEENVASAHEITCSLLPGGLLFASARNVSLEIYGVDGRLVCCTELKRGDNIIRLKSGVYFWEAGQYKGRATVR